MTELLDETRGRARTGAAGRVDAGEAAAATAVVVRLGEGRYAVDLRSVAEVVTVPTTTRVPGLPDWVAGVANWRGRVLSVADLRPLLGAALRPLPSSARLVVISSDGVEVGLLCEGVLGLLAADAGADPQPAPATATAAVAGLVSAVVQDGSGPVSVLDSTAVLALRHELQVPRSRP